MSKLVSVKNLIKYYEEKAGKLLVFKDVNFQVEKGETVALLGESGSGKTTLLNIIGTLDKPTLGEIYIKGKAVHLIPEEDLAPFRINEIGFVFQRHFLLPSMTALENVMLPHIEKTGNFEKAKKKAIELLKSVGLEHRLYHFPDELSGGERQRVAIARALINDPDLILADEPTGELDWKNRDIVLELMFRIVREFNKSIIIATHSQEVAGRADRILLLKEGGLTEQ